EKNLHEVNSWTAQMVKPFLVDGVVTSEHNNQSLPGLIYRLTTHSPSFVEYPNNQWTPVRWHNVVALSPETAHWLVKGFMRLFVLLVVWTCRVPRAGPGAGPLRRSAGLPAGLRPAGGLAAEYSIVVLGMLLFSERTWKHHCVTLLVPFAVLSYQL